eukprot:CAMPEP_0177608500 /NCGR_PEP_ID=MMETSP0419_2-20121207/18506_1 /TAXON_ID=582737 /ORGANISM="Tetraselmis sp., Strain GSL018" /LENGTH=184 /DNA_ID=CAMNT_0019103197 /DNA_START=346 /DNA_END=900 /DNA_ORIENTATION=-
MSGRPPAAFKVLDFAMRKPGTTPPLEIRLQRSLLPQDLNEADGQIRWKVRQESLPMRGQAAEQLPATVRGVCETCCYGSNAKEFWHALGFQVEYQSVREGALFVVWQGQHELNVRVSSIKKVQNGDPTTATNLTPEFWHVEVFLMVTTDAPSQLEGLYGEACRAISEFAGKVKDFVVLKKPLAR